MAATDLQRQADVKDTSKQNRFLPWRSRSNTTTSPGAATLPRSGSQPHLVLPGVTQSTFEQARARFESAMPPTTDARGRPRATTMGRKSSKKDLIQKSEPSSPKKDPPAKHKLDLFKSDLLPAALRIVRSPPASPIKSSHRSEHRATPSDTTHSRSASVENITTASSSMRDDSSMHSEASSHTSSRSKAGIASSASSVDNQDAHDDGPGAELLATDAVSVRKELGTVKRPPPLPLAPPPAVPALQFPEESKSLPDAEQVQRPATAHAILSTSIAPPSPALSVEGGSDAPRISFGTVSNITSVVYKGHTLDRSPTTNTEQATPALSDNPQSPAPPPTRQTLSSSQTLSSTTEVGSNDIPSKPLPPRPPMDRRSMSAERYPHRFLRDESNDSPVSLFFPKSVTSASSPDVLNFSSPLSPRQDKTQVIADAIYDLDGQANDHHERYMKLRHARQALHTEILLALQDVQERTMASKSPLQLQRDISNLDAGMDDCMSMLTHVEKQRQRLVNELLSHVQSANHTSIAGNTRHGRHQSLGIKEILSPTLLKPPLSAGLLSPMSATHKKFDGVNKQKDLPLPPRSDTRASAVSLSLANVMDFLDSADDPEVF